MITFFEAQNNYVYAVKTNKQIDNSVINRLIWLFADASYIGRSYLSHSYIGPRKEMVTPWSTNAVEITQNMGITGIERIELFRIKKDDMQSFDPMLEQVYEGLDQDIFTIEHLPDPVLYIDDIDTYNRQEGLALSSEEIDYLYALAHKINRQLTDSEIFGFSQVNSEHCRHKIFNGTFILNGKEQKQTLFQMIKSTTAKNPNYVVSAYKDNCAFLSGPDALQFAPCSQDKPDYFRLKPVETVISLKAETHNFPTTVEPFNGAATGTGGEIRDRVAGGKGALPLAGTAVYMTSYPRLNSQRSYEQRISPREWLYQTPEQILIKASNGASDFGNKFGQPLICGSLLTFEHEEAGKFWAFDKVIMLAGGIGYGNKKHSLKDDPVKGNKIVLLGGDNYRIGMGGGAVSSVATGEYGKGIELNAVQRSNPEMQKRVVNAIRALAESENNPVVSIHDHGAGGHLNCFSELVEKTGGTIHLDKLPVGDPTLSAKELIGNESQERIGIIIDEESTAMLAKISARERAPFYIVGETTGDHQFTFTDENGKCPIDLQLEDIFGNPPKTIMKDSPYSYSFDNAHFSEEQLFTCLNNVLQLESVACKDWLTNKVDRSVTGLVAKQQTCGNIQLPLNNLGIAAIDYVSNKGIATSIGHAPAAGLINASSGSVLSIAEALTNIIWAPLKGQLSGVSLSANWMWPCKHQGEDARLYEAVKAASDFAIALGINIPTGKDSLSMTQKYNDGSLVFSPGTVIISAAAEVTDIRKTIEPVIKQNPETNFLYIDLSGDDLKPGGSSFYQSLNALGTDAPTVKNPAYFKLVFETIQQLISDGLILSGHDISAGGMIVAFLEMCFTQMQTGMNITLDEIPGKDVATILFSENPGIIIQVDNSGDAETLLENRSISFYTIGKYIPEAKVDVTRSGQAYSFNVDELRDTWYRTSYLLDRNQCGAALAEKRYNNYKIQPLRFVFNKEFSGMAQQFNIHIKRTESTGIKSAIIREKGVNGDREMAYMMYLAGLDVKDVHMTDLVAGRETLEDVNLIVFVGGFSNSDVLGSAKGWAGAFMYNEEAQKSLQRFYARKDTLSLGVCNGCQLMVELNLINPDHSEKTHMLHNESGKFESSFLNVDIPANKSVMLGSLMGSRLGIWVAHGEGRFHLPYDENRYNVCMKYSYSEYPGNPNGSDYNIAGICSDDGRHLAIMPHLERSIFPWNWASYPNERKSDEVSPWIEAFVNAREWIIQKSRPNT